MVTLPVARCCHGAQLTDRVIAISIVVARFIGIRRDRPPQNHPISPENIFQTEKGLAFSSFQVLRRGSLSLLSYYTSTIAEIL